MALSFRCLFPLKLSLLILFLTTAPAAASVTVTICNTSTCDPVSCLQFDPVDQDQCMEIPGEPMPYSMFTCGDAYAVQTAFLRPSCGIYSPRTSRVFRSNSCVPTQDDPPRYIYVTCNTSVTMTRTTSADPECKTTTSTEVVIGSCNNFVSANGFKYSIIPTCERGLAVARSYLDHNCTGAKISTFHNSDTCDRTFMKDPVAVEYSCPARTSERLCLSIQYPEYILTGVGFAVIIVMILPAMYFVVMCYLLCRCCGLYSMSVSTEVHVREDAYVAMPTLLQDIAQRLKPVALSRVASHSSLSSVASQHELDSVNMQYGATDATQNDTAPSTKPKESEQVCATDTPPTAVPKKLREKIATKIKEKIAAFATISGLSSDTVRGLVCLATSSTAASITFIILACVNQTLQTSDRSAITFWIALCGYASVLVVGFVPTPHIAGRRALTSLAAGALLRAIK